MDLPISFEAAAAAAKTVKIGDNNVKLQIYGLFKFINASGGPTGSRPGPFDVQNRYKYDEWTKVAAEFEGKKDGKVRYSKTRYVNLIRVSMGGTSLQHSSQKLALATKNCPAFAAGCPFSSTLSTTELQNLMSSIPASHVGGGYVSESFKEIMGILHETKQVNPLIELIGKDGCPVKDVKTSSGKTFAEEMDLRTFDISTMSNGPMLSESLKEGTKKSHKEAENVSFVRHFLKGKITRENYAILTGNLYHVYTTMEACQDAHGAKVLGEMYIPEKLNRADRLLDDWRYLTQTEGKFPDPSPATRDYVERLKDISENDPKCLIAHAYTRYMGDLSGGQILARCARKALNLPETGEGGRFYEFPEIKEGGKKFKNTYRDMLDRVRPSGDERDRIVGEANVAFVLNMRLFEELDVLSGVQNASVRPFADALKWSTTWKEPGAEGGECPFGFTGPNPHGPSKVSEDKEEKKIDKTTAEDGAR
ncbi:hypothetical protein TL16_g10345 [Triparma laevis f. inornata]|uniref:heme oxygenase (biliverdin-producing) n=1 Tax=Triparma laevis f. inornata TaxID=1714386 RepID=A0A9W7EQC3_9STRA|nr:hypothetical protein TL16_g10345 [Triparma laevis f. inornata]